MKRFSEMRWYLRGIISVGLNTLRAAKKAFVGELRLLQRVNVIRRSMFFDEEWYLQTNPDVRASGVDPARHYLIFGASGNRNPSLSFVGDEYLALNTDVAVAGINPLLHYELHGKREGRLISSLEVQVPEFPEGSCGGQWRFERSPAKFRRTAVVASYFGKGIVPEKLLFLLRGLKEVVDNIILVADCPVFPEEVEKLRGIVAIARFERHSQYDFGSYRRGLEIAREEGFLEKDDVDELVIMNDSCYGPVFPFKESFESMADRPCDFWGMTPFRLFDHIHLQSYFYVMRRCVLDSERLDEFLSRVEGSLDRDSVIVLFEVKLTEFLASCGFKWDAIVSLDAAIALKMTPTKKPLTLMQKHRMPLLKVKAVDGDCFEDIGKTLSFVRKVNPGLADIIRPGSLLRTHKIVSYEEHQASFPSKCVRLAERVASGEKLKAVFLVSNASMFPAKPLFDVMLHDDMFDPSVVVVPDLRWRDGGHVETMEACRKRLAADIPEGRLTVASQDELNRWEDVLVDASIVCYPSPYELSNFRYNPRYAVGRGFLPICVNYGYYRSIYDRLVMGLPSYAYMWKAFFECDETMDEYAKHSILKGINAEKVGYVKMDALADVKAAPRVRKRILVALHHSVDGGTNKWLSLANFVRYADYFMELPDRYPEIDFVFRPHPFLFKVIARPEMWGVERVEGYVERLRKKSNVIWSDGGDYFREFAESDGCIQDCGSYLVEYFYTGKPCCYMLKSPEDIESKFAPLGRKCLEHCYIAYDTDAIDGFVRDVIMSGNDPKADARAEFAKTVTVNHPHAAEEALRRLKREILESR